MHSDFGESTSHPAQHFLLRHGQAPEREQIAAQHNEPLERGQPPALGPWIELFFKVLSDFRCLERNRKMMVDEGIHCRVCAGRPR